MTTLRNSDTAVGDRRRLSGVGSNADTLMKIDRNGRARLFTKQEIEILFTEGLRTDRDRTLFGVCLYTGCRIAEACSLNTRDIYNNSGAVRPSINFRKNNTKGKCQTRTIPVNVNLRSLLETWHPQSGSIFLFPGRPSNCEKHLSADAADQALRVAFARVGIEGASTHSFRRTALTQMSNAGIPLRVIQEISGHNGIKGLQSYLVVNPDQLQGAIASLSMLTPSMMKRR
jgi:integrase/recombinase XerD